MYLIIHTIVVGFLIISDVQRRSIHLQNFIFLIGFIILSTAQSVGALYAGRLIVGCASAFSAVADVPYLSEVSPLKYRGRMSSMYEVRPLSSFSVVSILCFHVL